MRAASASVLKSPQPTPASIAAPRAVDSSSRGRSIVIPATSAWNCIKQVVRGGAAVDAHARERRPEIVGHGLEQILDLERDALEHRAREVAACRAAGDAQMSRARRDPSRARRAPRAPARTRRPRSTGTVRASASMSADA
jgi:hypothetical protein